MQGGIERSPDLRGILCICYLDKKIMAISALNRYIVLSVSQLNSVK